MNKTSLWIVVVIAAAWIGFLLGYSMSAHTGSKRMELGTPAGGYGGPATGGYGSSPKPAAGGYGK